MSNHKNNVFLRGEGRSPWYRLDGSKFDCYLVGVAGGSASGKTSVAVRIIENLNVPWVVLLSMDSFYKELSLEKKIEAQNNNYNFDHPDAFDFDLLLYTLKNMKEGKKTEIPVYDFITHSRTSQKNSLYGANVVIFEGIFALYDQRIMDLMDLKEMVNEH